MGAGRTEPVPSEIRRTRRSFINASATTLGGSLLASSAGIAAQGGQTRPTPPSDWRNIEHVPAVLPHENYICQEYVVLAKNGDWVTIITTGPGAEAEDGQHLIVTISSDQGKTWSRPIDLEPGGHAPSASWALPYVTAFGRIYAFYNYNGDRITTLDGKLLRNNSELGWFCFKFSDDHGRTWSDRHRLPMRHTAVDYFNPWDGEVQLFWGVSKPITVRNSMYFSFTKMAIHPQEMGEGWLYKSDNINTEHDPGKLHWELLPEGEFGIAETSLGITQEEHNIVSLSDGSLYCIYRTSEGFPGHCYSHDGGRSWTKPEFATYADGRVIKNPRACARMFTCSNGKYLLWYHNNSMRNYPGYRNPAWLSGGVEKDGRIQWSEPEIVLYGVDSIVPNEKDWRKFTRLSYPDLVEQGGKYWVVEGQGMGPNFGRVHPIDASLLEGLWSQGTGGKVAKRGLVLDIKKVAASRTVSFPALPSLAEGSFTIDMWVAAQEWTPQQVLLDSRDSTGKGVWVSVTAKRTLQVSISDGKLTQGWDTDPGVVRTGRPQHVVFAVDGGPKIITCIVNGKLCDGGRYRPLGWFWFDPKLENVNGSDRLRLLPDGKATLASLRVYERYLTTSEAISNYHAEAIQR